MRGVDDGLVQAGRKNFFRINNTAGYQKALVGLISDLGVKSVSIIYSTKDATEGLATSVAGGGLEKVCATAVCAA